jgi:hypothetical protein
MRHVFRWPAVSHSLRLFPGRSVILGQLGAAMIAVNAVGQTAIPSPQGLLAADPHVFVRWLKSNRPLLPTDVDRSDVMRMLPPDGEVTELSGPEQRKLTGLRSLLQSVTRDSSYEIRVVDISLARVGIFGGLVLIISRPALTILSGDELRAQVAHEIGHQYVSGDYDRASAATDRRRLKELELLCDAIAIAQLQNLHIDPAALMTGIEKVTRYNRKKFVVDESKYPTLAERREFAREVAEWIGAASELP